MAFGAVKIRRASRGFTLLEMMVALAVFGIIGVMASRILVGLVGIGEFARERGDALAELQRAFGIIERDVEQLAYRAVRNELDSFGPEVVVGGDGLAEFTRAGWSNPLGLPRSELQRVAYARRDDALVRLYWSTLDRASDAAPITQTLISGVKDVAFMAYDSSGEAHSYWPRTDDDNEHGLAALQIRLRHERLGHFERLWATPAAPTPPASDPESPDGEPPADAEQS